MHRIGLSVFEILRRLIFFSNDGILRSWKFFTVPRITEGKQWTKHVLSIIDGLSQV